MTTYCRPFPNTPGTSFEFQMADSEIKMFDPIGLDVFSSSSPELVLQ